jgi:plasmid replication initiation protein
VTQERRFHRSNFVNTSISLLAVWANFRQRALDTAIAEINRKTDLSISIESLDRSKHRRVTCVTFTIKEQAVPDGD